jgi:cell division septation protein DedD
MPGLGKLYREEDQQLRFMADVEFEQMLQSFGHASIPLAAREAVLVDEAPKAAPVPMAAHEKEEPIAAQSASTGDTPVIPFRVKLGRAAAAVAIPLTLAGAYLLAEPAGTETLLGSNPFWNAAPATATYAPADRHSSLDVWETVDEEFGETVSEFVARTQWEGLLEYDLVAGRPAAGGVRVWVPAAPEPTPETLPTPAMEPVVEEPTTPSAEAPVVAPEPQPKPTVKPAVAEVNFLIVGGAFGVPKNAEKLAESMKSEGFETSLHFQNHNQLTIVAMGGYATEEAARFALEEARAKGHQKAWLKRL